MKNVNLNIRIEATAKNTAYIKTIVNDGNSRGVYL